MNTYGCSTPIRRGLRATLLCALGFIAAGTTTPSQAADAPAGFAGKDDWLFYRYEMSSAADTAAFDTSLELIRRFNKVLAANGVTMAVVMVPLKMRIYAEHLPADVRMSDAMRGNNERMTRQLRAAGVNVIDLNSAFLNSPARTGEMPLFFRLDTHWSPAGTLLAADTVKAGIDASPALKKIFDGIPAEAFRLVMSKNRFDSAARDLIEQLPKPAPSYAMERVFSFDVTRTSPAREDLLGERTAPAITLLGSSYSSDWTGFPKALRHALQRDLLAIAVTADRGSWIGMESYLRDDAFQASPAKLLIWEMPERDMRAPPDFKYRDARYVIENTEWLLRASAWVQSACKPAAATPRLPTPALTENATNPKSAGVRSGATADTDFVEIGFDKPLERLDYLSARLITNGSKSVTLEASGPGLATRRFAVTVAGDELAHALKVPLPSNGAGYTKVRIFPGKSSGFTLQNLQVCRQPEDLLK